ncbi:MAG TPA: general stress protein CsbD [Chitinophagales bacterium]|nr:general stress protein CsbD [Chitinophagales bacterium]
MSTTTTPTPGNWNEQKRKLQAKYTSLTDADLHFEDGKKETMFTKLQVKLGVTREQLDEVISS